MFVELWIAVSLHRGFALLSRLEQREVLIFKLSVIKPMFERNKSLFQAA